MKRSLRVILVLFLIALCLFVLLLLTRNFWRDQLEAYALGRIELTAVRYQFLPDDIDTVEVFTLKDDPNGNAYGFKGDFNLGTVGHKTLAGPDAKKIVDLWGRFSVGRELQAMCFQPVYGLQFKRRGKVYFQTAVCWECSGYTLSVPPYGTVQYGFDSKSDDAQELLKTLENYLPLPAEGTTNAASSK